MVKLSPTAERTESLTLTTVRRSTEDGHAQAFVLFGVAFLPHFVTTQDRSDAIVLAKGLGDIRAEAAAYSTLARSSTVGSLWISPKHLHHQTFLPRLLDLGSWDLANLIEGDAVAG